MVTEFSTTVLEHPENPEVGLRKLHFLSSFHCLASVLREPLWRIMNMARHSYLGNFGNTPGYLQHWSTRSFLRFLKSRFFVLEAQTPQPWKMALCRESNRHHQDLEQNRQFCDLGCASVLLVYFRPYKLNFHDFVFSRYGRVFGSVSLVAIVYAIASVLFSAGRHMPTGRFGDQRIAFASSFPPYAIFLLAQDMPEKVAHVIGWHVLARKQSLPHAVLSEWAATGTLCLISAAGSIYAFFGKFQFGVALCMFCA